MLRWRLILGAVFIGALIVLCWLDHRAALRGSYLLPLALVVSLLGAGELLEMFRKRGHQPLPGPESGACREVGWWPKEN